MCRAAPRICDDTRSLPRATVRHVRRSPADLKPVMIALTNEPGMRLLVSSAGSADFLPTRLRPVIYMVPVPANSAYFMN